MGNLRGIYCYKVFYQKRRIFCYIVVFLGDNILWGIKRSTTVLVNDLNDNRIKCLQNIIRMLSHL